MAKNPNFELRNRIVSKYRTQADFAPEVGMREDCLSRVINGRDSVKPDQARRIAEKLDCAVEDIFPGGQAPSALISQGNFMKKNSSVWIEPDVHKQLRVLAFNHELPIGDMIGKLIRFWNEAHAVAPF